VDKWLRPKNVTIDGHRTSIRLEPAYWDAVCDIARRQHKTVHQLASEIARDHHSASLTNAIRCFAVSYYRGQEGHARIAAAAKEAAD
jgi:predicted DNA-binding ribbon-helix-helix protein